MLSWPRDPGRFVHHTQIRQSARGLGVGPRMSTEKHDNAIGRIQVEDTGNPTMLSIR